MWKQNKNKNKNKTKQKHTRIHPPTHTHTHPHTHKTIKSNRDYQLIATMSQVWEIVKKKKQLKKKKKFNNNERPRKKSNQIKFFEDRYTILFLHHTPVDTVDNNGNVVSWHGTYHGCLYTIASNFWPVLYVIVTLWMENWNDASWKLHFWQPFWNVIFFFFFFSFAWIWLSLVYKYIVSIHHKISPGKWFS